VFPCLFTEHMLVFMKFPSNCSKHRWTDVTDTMQKREHAWGKGRCTYVNAGCLKVNNHCYQNMPLKNVTHFKEDILLWKSLHSHFESAHQYTHTHTHTHTGIGLHYRRIRQMKSCSSLAGAICFCFPNHLDPSIHPLFKSMGKGIGGFQASRVLLSLWLNSS